MQVMCRSFSPKNVAIFIYLANSRPIQHILGYIGGSGLQNPKILAMMLRWLVWAIFPSPKIFPLRSSLCLFPECVHKIPLCKRKTCTFCNQAPTFPPGEVPKPVANLHNVSKLILLLFLFRLFLFLK